MKKIKILFVIIIWVIIGVFLYKEGLITTDISKFSLVLGDNPVKMFLVFMALSTLRIVFFIPQIIFIILGSLIFGPYEGFLLSLISLLLSQTIMYIVGRVLRKYELGKTLISKNKKIVEKIKTYGYRFLALGIVCPITPTEIVILSAGCIQLNYRKTIFTLILTEGPKIFLYGFIGEEFKKSIVFPILFILVVGAISYYTLHLWKKINDDSSNIIKS